MWDAVLRRCAAAQQILLLKPRFQQQRRMRLKPHSLSGEFLRKMVGAAVGKTDQIWRGKCFVGLYDIPLCWGYR